MELSAKNCSAVIVTRGTYDISDVISHLRKYFDDIVVWEDNREHTSLYGRYLAIESARFPYIYTQDDDCLVNNIPEILNSYSDGITCAMSKHHKDFYEGTGVALLGWGSVFHRSCRNVLQQYIDKYGYDEHFFREADRIFTFLNDKNIIESNITNIERPQAMSLEDGHYKSLDEVIKKLKTL